MWDKKKSDPPREATVTLVSPSGGRAAEDMPDPPESAVELAQAVVTTAQPLLAPGAVVDERFEVLRPAGEGGMAIVYQAVDRRTGSRVALKVTRTSPQLSQRFEREARLLAELKHPGLVEYVAHGVAEQGTAYLAMEWLEGRDLATHLGIHSPSVRQAVEVVRQAAAAVAVAHRVGVIHRDLNPRNLFLVDGRLDSVRVLDFGVARALDTLHALTIAGSAVGTPGYMAPEQAKGSAELSPAVDVFALGCVLFECLTGRKAFTGARLLELLAKILVEEVPRASSINPQVPRELDLLLAAMLAKDPRERPADASSLLERLGRLNTLDLVSTPPPVSIAAVSHREQRISCVMLARVEPQQAPAAMAATAELGVVPQRLADGTLVALLGGRTSPTDQAVRAARCALAVRQVAPLAPIALATGRAITIEGASAGYAIEVASAELLEAEHMERLAPDQGLIVIDDVTAGLLDSRFELRADGRRYVLFGMRTAAEPVRTVLGRQTRCVGRARELGLLTATLAECRNDGVSNVVLVTGPPGIGKSRLAQELMTELRESGSDCEVLLGRGDPMSMGSPFAILAQAISRAALVHEGEPLAERRQKLGKRLGRHLPPSDLVRVTEFIGELTGTPYPDTQSPQLYAARQDPVLRGDQILRALEDWLEAECKAHPVLLVLDDLHWGDLATVKQVDSVLRNLRDKPLMVLALARPEIHELFPDLWAARHVSELRLSGLSHRASAALVRQVLGSEVDEAVVRRVTERAQGNPFWLEELLRSEASGSGRIPERVMVLAQSRLEGLDGEARRVLRAGSVFGQHFWRRGVAELLAPDTAMPQVDAALRSLIDNEVLVDRFTSSFPGEKEFEFVSGLLRDAAYASLAEEDARRAHAQAARWLEKAGERDAVALATHYERAGELGEASLYYAEAAEQALGGGALAAALSRAEDAIRCGAQDGQLAELYLLQAEACKWLGRNAEAAERSLLAMPLAERGSATWCGAVGEAMAASGKLGKLDECKSLCDELLRCPSTADNETVLAVALSRSATQLALAGELALCDRLLSRLEELVQASSLPPAVMGWVFEARAVRAGAGDDAGARRQLAEHAIQHFEQAGDQRNACLQQISLGFACIELGAYADAEVALRGALIVAERMALSNSIPIAKAQLGRAMVHELDSDAALALEREAVSDFDRQGNTRLAGVARTYLASMLERRAHFREAEQMARRAVELLGSAAPLRRAALARLALILLARGEAEEALQAAREANEGVAADTELGLGEALIRLSLVEALNATGDRTAAVAALRAAHDRLLDRAARIASAVWRRQFLQQVPENARTIALARAPLAGVVEK
jgi:tetratricopeptide (TPR) repeat protein